MNKTNKIKSIKMVALVIVASFATILSLSIIYIDNKNIHYEHFELYSSSTYKETIKIIHLSDLHFPKIKVDLELMLSKLKDEKPQIIAITGDLIDDNATVSTSGVVKFLEKLKTIAPIYYVTGNHEVRNYSNFFALETALKANDVTILNNTCVNIRIHNIEITIIGLSDNTDYDKKYVENIINSSSTYKILLAHRPEKWNNYTSTETKFQPNLVLTGHAHGGQFRLFNNGLFAPNQGFFPKYDSGSFKSADGNCSMIVSRGIGNSLFPFRFNNNPNIPIITIKL